MEKYNLIEAKVDHGLYRGKKRKKPSSKNQFHVFFLKKEKKITTKIKIILSERELEDWKIGRAKDTEGWKQKQKYKHKKVISSKRRGYKKYKVYFNCVKDVLMNMFV